MPTAYLDYNVLVGIAGVPPWPDAAVERAHIQALRSAGFRFVLSAWHAMELARSTDTNSVQQCCRFAEELGPLWANNARDVQQAELFRLLASWGDADAQGQVTFRPLSDTVPQMWASYGGLVFLDASFTGTVSQLRSDRQYVQEMQSAAKLTPAAIAVGRAAHGDGRLRAQRQLIDRDYYAGLLRCRKDDPRLDKLIAGEKDVRRQCPAVAVEGELTMVRVRDGFTPQPSDAPDLQHALAALPHCDYFVSDDAKLRNHCELVVRRLNLPVKVFRRVSEIQVPSDEIN